MLHWFTGLISRGRNASTRRYNSDVIELEVKLPTKLLWATHSSESANKPGGYGAGWVDWRKLNYYSIMEVKKIICGS